MVWAILPDQNIHRIVSNRQGSQSLAGVLAAIDHRCPDSVYVMVLQDGVDIAGVGGLMITAIFARDFFGSGD